MSFHSANQELIVGVIVALMLTGCIKEGEAKKQSPHFCRGWIGPIVQGPCVKRSHINWLGPGLEGNEHDAKSYPTLGRGSEEDNFL